MNPNKAPRSRLAKASKRLAMSLLLSLMMVISIGLTASVAIECECTPCHGDFDNVHGDFSHIATPPSGGVTIFSDYTHDDAGWRPPLPHFEVLVDCGTCHAADLLAIHANNCATCHPTPYDTIGTWNGGCQQGGCHSAYHEDSTTAHLPFEDTSNPSNDCNLCHEEPSFIVPQSNCLNCHAAYDPDDITLPVTTSNALPEYDGPAQIVFSITDNGKVGIGTTFYQLDGNPVTTGSQVLTSDLGTHILEFWSVDQAGNVESPTNSAFFEIVEDTTPPTTTSDARETYSYLGGVITLTATDDSTQGVKNTYFSLNGAPTQSGTNVTVPATNQALDYTLIFWSVDWSENVESPNSVNFSTTGLGVIRLVWWDSDVDPSHAPIAGDYANWTVRRGSRTGPIVATGSNASPGWDGIDDVAVEVIATPYFVRVDWGGVEYGGTTYLDDVLVDTPGTVKLNY